MRKSRNDKIVSYGSMKRNEYSIFNKRSERKKIDSQKRSFTGRNGKNRPLVGRSGSINPASLPGMLTLNQKQNHRRSSANGPIESTKVKKDGDKESTKDSENVTDWLK